MQPLAPGDLLHDSVIRFRYQRLLGATKIFQKPAGRISILHLLSGEYGQKRTHGITVATLKLSRQIFRPGLPAGLPTVGMIHFETGRADAVAAHAAQAFFRVTPHQLRIELVHLIATAIPFSWMVLFAGSGVPFAQHQPFPLRNFPGQRTVVLHLRRQINRPRRIQRFIV